MKENYTATGYDNPIYVISCRIPPPQTGSTSFVEVLQSESLSLTLAVLYHVSLDRRQQCALSPHNYYNAINCRV